MRVAPLIIAAALAVTPDEIEAALAHRASLPVEQQVTARYLSLSSVEDELRDGWASNIRFAVPLASRGTVIEHQMPQRVTPTLYWIDLYSLRWDAADWHKVVERQPYSQAANPLIVRGEWLVVELSDGTRSDAYYRLLYGSAKIPKTRDQFLAFWGVQKKTAGFEFGLVEGASRVNKARSGSRWIEHHFGVATSAWGTRDVLEISAGKDPLNAPAGDFKHDAEEWFVLVPQTSTTGARCVKPVTLLSDGAGRVQQSAPPQALEDYTRFGANEPLIVNPGSCISCHDAGPQQPSVNAVRELLATDVRLYAYDQITSEFIERFHLGGIAKELGRWQEDWSIYCELTAGLTTEDASRQYRELIGDYWRDVTLERASLELHCTPHALALSIAYARTNGFDVGVRLVQLAYGNAMPRTAWEADYLKARLYLDTWNQRN